MRKWSIKLAGIINLLTAFIHLIGGEWTLVDPLMNSSLTAQQQAEWIGAWHIVTIILFYSSYLILTVGFSEVERSRLQALRPLAILYILMGIPFVISSIYFSVFAPQWILLQPIGVLYLIGLRKFG